MTENAGLETGEGMHKGVGATTEKDRLNEQEITIKKDIIRRACDARDVQALIYLANTFGGLLDDNLRCMACTSCIRS